jgi:uncharacterized protein YjlB
VRITPYFFSDDGSVPNSCLPLLVYSNAIDLGAKDPALDCETIFANHGWSGFWRNGIYAYHHYHSTSHEVLGCYGGNAEVLFGGEMGLILPVHAGDVLLIPAGVGHFNKRCDSDFAVVGGYPQGFACDMRFGNADERPTVLENIAALPVPPEDPVLGTPGGLKDYWL